MPIWSVGSKSQTGELCLFADAVEEAVDHTGRVYRVCRRDTLKVATQRWVSANRHEAQCTGCLLVCSGRRGVSPVQNSR